MVRDLVVIGAGGFGRETIDVIRAINEQQPTWNLVGVADDAPSATNLGRLSALGVSHLGSIGDIPRGLAVAVAVGQPSTRKRIVATLTERWHSYPSLAHPGNRVGSAFRHGIGLISLPGASIGTNVTLGDHVHLSANAVVGHDSQLGNYVSVNPNATVSGEVHLDEGSLIGAGSVILQGLRVGRQSTVGAGACVVRNTPDLTTVKGVPAT
ncbi:NeuD/PglB/VioB family sugar acetyltransferase [Ornithinimicrobium faecis]|uniref:NeuD/PglB/VioB family sugar acetyltransferase n=1 Tax=Ornithinimicrobium faecis TaxID=2934158 RepID=A0ABY4YSN0_9MICO|nr:NeuD/PglB/VioB family sugar acetyltransferase [Ornithinimicrobium sp. HY1793]USQ79777.1 NeuD/PglB/VioB family sugar acetyltransferase [Ornithinimicrobium sp. HY1793]